MRRVRKPTDTAFVEARDPCPHCRLTQVERPSDGGRTLPTARLHNDPGSLDITRRSRAGPASMRESLLFIVRQRSDLQRHRIISHSTQPAEMASFYPVTLCRTIVV
jgi:hypothetical protein